MKQLMDQRDGYFFEIRFDQETKEIRTNAKIPLGLMAKGIGTTLARLDITDEEFSTFMLGLANEFSMSKNEKGTNSEQE
jgi:hypothetical protein